jgi:hypothetical protein
MQLRSLLTRPGVHPSDASHFKTALDARIPAHLETATFASG